MKKLHFFLWLALFLTASVVLADDSISLTPGESQIIRLPFVLKSYRISPPDTKVIKVEDVDPNLSVTGISVGQVSLIVNGVTGDQRIYSIVVKSDLEKIKREIERYLENVPELDISINENRIVIKGFVTNPDHWSQLQKVLSLYSNVVNFASFALSSDALMDLKTRLQNAGFVFAKEGETPKVGELSLTSTSDTIFLSGELHSQASLDKLSTTLAGVPILATKLINVSNTVTVAKTLLSVNVAFVSMSASDDYSQTGNLNPIAAFDGSFLQRWLDGKETGKTLGFNTSMGGTLSFMQTDMKSKLMDSGEVSFANGKNGDFKSGGTIKVPVSGIENGDLKDISFGYSVSVGGELISATEAQIHMNGSLNEVKSISPDGTYVMEDNTVNVDVPVELGKTFAISHHRKETEITSITGTPILKDIPILGIPFRDKITQKQISNTVVLVCVEVLDRTVEPPAGTKPDTKAVLEETKQSTQEMLDKPFSDKLDDALDKIVN